MSSTVQVWTTVNEMVNIILNANKNLLVHSLQWGQKCIASVTRKPSLEVTPTTSAQETDNQLAGCYLLTVRNLGTPLAPVGTFYIVMWQQGKKGTFPETMSVYVSSLKVSRHAKCTYQYRHTPTNCSTGSLHQSVKIPAAAEQLCWRQK